MYRQHITIKHDVSPDGTADPDYQTLVENVPCNLKPVGGGEYYRGRQIQADVTLIIETRYIAGWKPNMIAVNDVSGETYYFKRLIDHQSRQRTWIIDATEAL